MKLNPNESVVLCRACGGKCPTLTRVNDKQYRIDDDYGANALFNENDLDELVRLAQQTTEKRRISMKGVTMQAGEALLILDHS